MDRAGVPVGAVVVAADGETLGTVHAAHAHFFVFRGKDEAGAPADYEVPMHAVTGIEGGRVQVSVNLGALNAVPAEEQSAAHRLGQE